MKQTIAIENLWCETIIGIYPHERGTTQPLCLSVHVEVDATRAIAEESIAATLDYELLAHTLKAHTEGHCYQLLETLLSKLLGLVASFETVQSASISISKPKALEQIGATVRISGSFER